MTRFHQILIASALLVISACGGGGSSPAPSVSPTANTTVVTIPARAMTLGAAAYGTNPLVIKVGTQVSWMNDDTVPHTATSDTGVWDSGTITSGQSFATTFNTVGTFPYHCTIHGAAAMSGTIQVTN